MTGLERSSHPIGVLRAQIAPDASDEELAFFAQVCARLDLSPFADQIVLVGRYDKRLNRKVHRHQITVAGRRALAERTGQLQGIDGPEWCGPRNSRGQLEWRDVWDDDNTVPYCARVFVYRAGWVKPANGTAKWSEFAQCDSAGMPLPTWTRMPSHMLGKVAESLALRRAFPDTIDHAVAGADMPSPGMDADGYVAELAEAEADVPTPVVAADWMPTARDQADAHRRIAALPDAERDLFLMNWTIETFGEVWPPGAVADALGFEQETAG